MKRSIILTLLLLACTGDGPAESPAPADDTGEPANVDVPFDEELGEELTAALNSGLEDRNVVGMAMALKLPGTELFITAAGTSDLEAERAMEATDRFRIASISKTFTATVVLQLVDEGLLGLDDLLADHVDLLANDTGITLRHLLDHTAGVPEYSDTTGFQLASDEPWTDEEIIALVADEALLDEPGASWSYSNSHYVLLGLVITEVTGAPWQDAVATRLFDGLGLADTEIPTGDWGDIVPCYVGQADFTDSIHPEMGAAAGGLTSTVSDLATWGEAYGSGALISEATFAEQTSDPIEVSPGFIWSGMGIILMGDGLDDSELELGHNGALNGAAGWMGHRPGRGGTLVILGNSWPRSGGSYDYQYPLMLSWDIWDIVEAADP